MWIREIVAAAAGLVSGTAAAAGSFALISSIGVIPRMAAKSSTSSHVTVYETAVICGGTAGNILTILGMAQIPAGAAVLAVSGVFAGVFVGCLAAALAEVLQVWPLIFRRSRIKCGLQAGMFCFAMGKLAGALYYFIVLYRK